MHNCANELANPSQSSNASSESSTKHADTSAGARKAYPSPPQTPKKPASSPSSGTDGKDSLHPTRLTEALSSMMISSEATSRPNPWSPISPTSPSDALPTPQESAPAAVSPREILHAAYERTVATFRASGTAGSSTALVAVLRDGELSVAHLGDCMLAVVRDGKYVVRTEEMQHSVSLESSVVRYRSVTDLRGVRSPIVQLSVSARPTQFDHTTGRRAADHRASRARRYCHSCFGRVGR